jgi:hypothetical protein
MNSVNRRLERKFEIYDTISNLLNKKVNQCLIDNEVNNEILEGTGSLVCDYRNKFAFAALSPRTSSKCLDQFENLTGFSTCRFNSYGPDGNLIYHTNVMMTVCDQYVCIYLFIYVFIYLLNSI